MKPPIYLTDPEAMRKVRLNQPRVSSAQLRAQFEEFRRESGKSPPDAKPVISLRGRAKAAA